MDERWIETALAWEVTAEPRYNAGDEEHIREKGYRYCYFSYYRPASFIFGIDLVLVRSTDECRDFIYLKEPLPAERICKWELIPVGEDARSFLARARNGEG